MEGLIIKFFVGTYETKPNKSLFCFELNEDTFEVNEIFSLDGFMSASYLCLDEINNKLFVAEEFAQTISSVSLEDFSKTSLNINEEFPCHIFHSRENNKILISNYGSGSLSVIKLDDCSNLEKLEQTFMHRGKSVNKNRQESAHIHFSGGKDKEIWVVDLGIDKVKNYNFHQNKLASNLEKDISVPAGTGPRHFVFGKNRINTNYMYLVGELSNEVLVIDTENKKIVQVISTLKNNAVSNTCAAIKMSEKGDFIYVSNRGEDTIAVFKVKNDGKLELIQSQLTYGENPRDFSIFDNILLVANQSSNNITIFKIKEGKLEYTGKSKKCSNPVCII